MSRRPVSRRPAADRVEVEQDPGREAPEYACDAGLDRERRRGVDILDAGRPQGVARRSAVVEREQTERPRAGGERLE